jgi:hypothetical protein
MKACIRYTLPNLELFKMCWYGYGQSH